MAKLPDGEETRVGFSLSFVSNPMAPWLGVFACQHYAPAYYAQAPFQKHANDAVSVLEVWAVGSTARDLGAFFQAVIGSPQIEHGEGRISLKTPTGDLVLATPQVFTSTFGCTPPNMADAPCLAGLVIGCRSLDSFHRSDMLKIGPRYGMPPDRFFRTALAFAALSR